MLRLFGALLLVLPLLEAQRRCYKVNEVWKTCSSRCEPTCQNQTPACIKSCGPPSCQCNTGYFRDDKSGECLNKYQCAPPPSTCAVTKCAAMTQCVEGPNGPSCVPIPTDPVGPSGPTCSSNAQCPYGMSCVQGQYGLECQNVHIDPPQPKLLCENLKCRTGEYCTESDGNPSCVKYLVDPIPPTGPICKINSDCPSDMNCIDGQYGRECAPVHVDPTMAPISCDNLRCPDGEFCVNEQNGPRCQKAPVDPIPSVPRCNRKCKRRQKCVTDSINGPVCKVDDGCGPNEVMKQCSNACFEKNCGEEQFTKQCSFVCGAPKCQCAEGFMRETNTRACVKPSQCPPPIEYSTTTEATTTDNTIPCGDTRCHPAWTCQRIEVPCTRSPCPSPSYFCMAPHTVPPPTCGDQYCSTSETCETMRASCTRPPCPPDRKVCVLMPGATSPPAPSLPESCGPHGMICPEGETCQVAMASCIRSPCPPPVYSCSGYTATTTGYTVTTTTPSSGGYGTGPSLPDSCATVRCPRGQTCRMQEVRCIRAPCSPVPTCQMRIHALALLLLIPLCNGDVDTQKAELGFDCDEKKCTFTLEIPQASVSFVDVPLLNSEIDILNGNLTDLRCNGDFVANQTKEFQNDFNESSEETISTLNELFALKGELVQTTNTLLKEASKKKGEADSLSFALKCIVNGGLPSTCYSPPTAPPSTESPSTTTVEGSGEEGSGEGSGDGIGGDSKPLIIDGDIDLLSDMLLT